MKYGKAQIDNKDTIKLTLTSNPNLYENHTILQDTYCRNNVLGGGANQPLRDTKSNNIFTGLQLSFVYTFPSKKS